MLDEQRQPKFRPAVKTETARRLHQNVACSVLNLNRPHVLAVLGAGCNSPESWGTAGLHSPVGPSFRALRGN
jgi:hypothetical protein